MSKLWYLLAAAVCVAVLPACGANKGNTTNVTAPAPSVAATAVPQPTKGEIDDLCTKFRAITIPQIEQITGETVTEATYMQGQGLGGPREACAFNLSALQAGSQRPYQFFTVSVDNDPQQKLWKKINRQYVTETSGYGDEALIKVPGRAPGIVFRKGVLVVEVSFSAQKDTPEGRHWTSMLAARADANLV